MATQQGVQEQYDAAIDARDIDALVALVEKHPQFSSNILNTNQIYEQILLPQEERAFNRQMADLTKVQNATLRSSEGRNTDLSARLGIQGTAAGQGLQRTLNSSAAREFAVQRAQAAQGYQERINNPSRLAGLRRITNAIQTGYDRRAAEGGAVTGAIGAGLGVASAATSSIPVLSAILGASGAATAGIGAGAAAGDRQAGKTRAGHFSAQIGKLKPRNFSQGIRVPGGVGGFDVRAAGAGTNRLRFNLTDEDENYPLYGTP
jgi:hypothetical protein